MCHQEHSGITKGSAFAADLHAPTSATKQSSRPVTWSELTKHNTVEDAWIAIKGRVYDITSFVPLHPGGDILLTAAGQDATDVFAGFHASTDAWRFLPPLCVGVLEHAESPPLPNVSAKYLRDLADLRKQVRKLRLYDSSKLFYTYKILCNVSICALSVAMIISSGSWPMVLLAGVVMALFWQQCGWLAHDFLHHQVFVRRSVNNMFGVLIGNIFQGFSVSWWKNKHNRHHAVPNVTDAPSGGDPDIATMPILFWSEKLVDGELDGLPKWMLRNQSWMYWAVLCFARISWLLQSILYNFPKPNPNVTSAPLYCAEIAGLVIHHVLYLALLVKVALLHGIAKSLVYALTCHAMGGVMLGVVFVVGHNAMEVLTLEEMRRTDFVRLQTRTTRNVDPHWFYDWFTGGLSYQVEHHIFPTIPRHHLPKLRQLFMSFCAKHNIPYSSDSFLGGNIAVIEVLKQVSNVSQ